MKHLRSKLTYANVMVTVLAFIVLAGGTAFATSAMLPKNSVGSKQIKKEAVTPAKLSKAAKKTLTGPAGATGPVGLQGKEGKEGAPGKNGNPGAYATVIDSGPPSFAGSHPGFTAVTSPAEGVYCLTPASGIDYSHPIASVEWYESSGSDLLAEPIGGEQQSDCPAGQLEVRTYHFPGGTAALYGDISFSVFVPQG
jgi:hypothetical protein